MSVKVFKKKLAQFNSELIVFAMDIGYVMREEPFLIISQIIGQFVQMGRINCGLFGVFPGELSAYTLSFCVLSS